LSSLACVGALLPGAAFAALPRTYQVQAIDRPAPGANGNFGLALVNTGDVNGDGKDDLLVGTDEHGGSVGPVYVISGADGSVIRSISAPDGGGSGAAAGFGSYVGKLSDVGSCPGGASGVTCPNPTIGAPDGVPDQLATALGVDVGGLVDAGRAYVIDGATGAVLKRLDMPASDLAEQAAAPGGAAKPGFGRTILNPSSQFGPTKSNLSGPDVPPLAVRIGDMNGGGQPDIVIGASDYFETGSTANPDSACASTPSNQCLQAGRAYVYYGESIVGTDPSVPDNNPNVTIKNLAAQPDDLTTPVNGNRESFGYSIEPVGDLGRCTTTPGAGAFCVNSASTGTADGKPDVVISSHRTDDFGMFDVGVALLIDGASDSVLYQYRHPEPQPASLFGFSNYNQPAVGDLGSSVTPDVYQAAMRQNNPYTGGGRGYGMNGAFKQSGSPNSISFATFNDPTPNPSEDFGTSSAGIGNVVGAEGGLDGRNEVMIGAYGPHNPGTAQGTINDVHIFSALTEQPLQEFKAPDQQPGVGFGTALAPMGDLNGDGFQDYAIGAGLYDAGANADQGRIYVFRSDNSPAPPATTPPAGGQGAVGPAGAAGKPAVVAGRTLTLVASRSRVARRARVRLKGLLEAFANPAGCERHQRVRIQRRSVHSVSYRKVKTVKTGKRGGFSLGIRPTSTGVYRARVSQTSACLGAASPPERVTVTKAKGAKR
jgi:hypothetical protein